MTVETKAYDDIVSEQVTAIQAKVPNFQFPEGSINLSLVESNAGVCLWLQGISLQVAALTRASSCTGSDLDSFYAQFRFPRNKAVFSSGLITISRFNAVVSATVPVGSAFQTSVGQVQFTVYKDETNPYWNTSQNGYVLPPSINSISIPVVCTIAGNVGNVGAGTINQIASSVPVDTVTNPAAFINGRDSESDSAYSQRFIIFINSLYAGTILAYENAITEGRAGIFYNIKVSTDINGNALKGFNSVIIDDGSGTPPQTLLDSITESIDRINAAGIGFGVYPVVVLNSIIDIDIILESGASQSDTEEAIESSVSQYVSSLQIGQKLNYTKLFQIVYDSSTQIAEVNSILINGTAADLIPNFKEKIYISAINITAT
jgi:hypothetical protein